MICGCAIEASLQGWAQIVGMRKVGNSPSRTGSSEFVGHRQIAADYDDDMRRAKQMGIDAFSLNLGTENYGEPQLELAYQSAADNKQHEGVHLCRLCVVLNR